MCGYFSVSCNTELSCYRTPNAHDVRKFCKFFSRSSHHLPSTVIYFLHVGHTTQQPSRWSECMSERSYINTQPHSGHVIFFSLGGSLPSLIILIPHSFYKIFNIYIINTEVLGGLFITIRELSFLARSITNHKRN